MVKNLTVEEFKENVFDYAQEKEWLFKGKKPAVIDFYADWCNPCKSIAPILEELSDEMPDIDFYKINTEEQPELAMTFGIQSIPSILFVPLEGQPQLAMGALPKDTFVMAINQVIHGIAPEVPVEEPVEGVQGSPEPDVAPDEEGDKKE